MRSPTEGSSKTRTAPPAKAGPGTLTSAATADGGACGSRQQAGASPGAELGAGAPAQQAWLGAALAAHKDPAQETAVETASTSPSAFLVTPTGYHAERSSASQFPTAQKNRK